MAAVRSTAALPAPGWAYLCLRLAVAALCLLVLCARPAQPLALRDDVHAVAGLRGEEGQQEERSGVEVQQGAPAASARMICVGEGCPARRDKQLCIQPVTVHSHPCLHAVTLDVPRTPPASFEHRCAYSTPPCCLRHSGHVMCSRGWPARYATA